MKGLQEIVGLFLIRNFYLYCSNFEQYIRFIMKDSKTKDTFEVLRKVYRNPKASQRQLAQELGFSLGKLNYCLKALKEKGLIKIDNFQKKKNRIKYIQYMITPKGISERTKLTVDFMKRKMKEYDDLKRDLN